MRKQKRKEKKRKGRGEGGGGGDRDKGAYNSCLQFERNKRDMQEGYLVGTNCCS